MFLFGMPVEKGRGGMPIFYALLFSLSDLLASIMVMPTVTDNHRLLMERKLNEDQKT